MLIKLDSKFGKEIGFTSDKFFFYSYLHKYKYPKVIWISAIKSIEEGKGHFSKLLKAIWDKGYKIKVPTPSIKMKEILIYKKFKKDYDNGVEVWIK